MAPDGVMSFGVNPMRAGYPADRQQTLLQDAVRTLREAPGVESVALAVPSPFWRGTSPASVKTEPTEASAAHSISVLAVTSDYFRTLQIPLRSGRVFTDAEFGPKRQKNGLGIINETLARQLFGSTHAVGRRFYSSQAARDWRPDRTIEVIGVVGDTRSGANFRGAPPPLLYEPSASTIAAMTFFVRSNLEASAALAMIAERMRALEPNLPIVNAGTVRDEIARLIPEDRVLAWVLGVVAVLATLLGVAGVHAVVAHTVAQRTREFGIRLALGAPPAAIAGGVLRHVLVVAIIGLAAGIALFSAGVRVVEARLFGVAAIDPVSLSAVTAILAVAALAGAWIPARRATHVDPLVTLRIE
jgi:hypothetical protein